MKKYEIVSDMYTLGSMVGASFFLCNKCVSIGDVGEEDEVVEDTVVVETGNTEGNLC